MHFRGGPIIFGADTAHSSKLPFVPRNSPPTTEAEDFEALHSRPNFGPGLRELLEQFFSAGLRNFEMGGTFESFLSSHLGYNAEYIFPIIKYLSLFSKK
jgi:hypothetical protein